MKLPKIIDAIGMSYIDKGLTSPVQPSTQEAPTQPPVSNQTLTPEQQLKALGPKKVILEWSAQSRTPKNTLNQKAQRTIIVLAVIFCLLLALMQEFILILAIAGIIYISFALSKMEPEMVKITLSNHGIHYGENTYLWSELSQYFYKAIDGHEVLAVDTIKRLPSRIFILFESDYKNEIDKVLSEHLTRLDKEPESVMDKLYTKVSEKINLNSRS